MTAPAPRGHRALGLAVLVLAGGALVGAAFLNLLVRRHQEDERRRASELGTERAYLLEKQLDQLVVATSTLPALLRRREARDFATLAAGVLESSPALAAVVLAPEGRVTEVYPADAEEGESDLSTLAPGEDGPRVSGVRLAGGSYAFFGLRPFAAGTDGQGFVGASLRLDELTRAARLGELTEEGYRYQLLAVDPQSGRRRMIRQSTELDLEEPIDFPIAVRGGDWTLSLAPREGWSGWSSRRPQMVLVGVVALLAALVTHELARQPERLRRQVDQRSHHLRRARRRLDAEMRERAQAEARELWSGLDRLSRMALVAAGRPNDPEGDSERAIVGAVTESLESIGMEFRSEEVRAALYRLEERGLLARDRFDRVRVEKPIVFSLPETGKSLTEIARDTMERIGPYRIERRLGGGGMGEVFQAVNEEDDTTAAVKLLYPHALDDEEQRRRFEREGDMVARLDHPNVVRLLDRGQYQGRLYIAMELVAGETIDSLLRGRGSLTPEEALSIVGDMARALAALHELGIVHRDVKSSNVMVTPAGSSVLLDLGLASRMTSQALTRSNTVLGTVPYMAPERLRGERGTPQVDVWAAGVLLFEMLAGKLPWKNPDELTLVNEILMMDELPIRTKIGPIAGPETVELLEAMLAWSPRRRLRDGREMIARISELPGGLAPPRRAHAAPPGPAARTPADPDVPPTAAAPGGGSSEVDPTAVLPVRDLDESR